MNIHKEVFGTGEDIVIIHGGLANDEDMLPIVEHLSNRYRVTNVSLPGNGKTKWNDTIKTVHDEANTILPELPEKATYIGWSKGGLVIQSIAINHPHRIKHLIGIGTTPKFIEADNWIGVQKPGFMNIVREVLKDPNATVHTFLNGAANAEFANFNPKPNKYQQILNNITNRSDIPKNVIETLISIVDNTDLRQEFKNISCPIDLIMGSDDPNVPTHGCEQIKTLNTLVNIHKINGAKHAPFWTHPKEFNQILDEILAIH